MPLRIAGHEFDPTDADAPLPSRTVSSILDEVGRDSSAGRRIRQACAAEGRDPEEAVLVDPEVYERVQTTALEFGEAHAELLEVASKALRGRYGWSASSVEALSEAELIEALAIEEHYDDGVAIDLGLDAPEEGGD